MSTLRNQVGLLLRASLVERYHNRTTLKTDTVGRHSFMVAWFCWFLYDEHPRSELILAALQHDVAEGVIGDIPAPVTRAVGRELVDKLEAQVLERFALPDYAAALSPVETLVLKLADRLDGLLYSTLEVRGLGNRALHTVMERYAEYATLAAVALPDPYKARGLELVHACGAVMDNLNIGDEEDVGL